MGHYNNQLQVFDSQGSFNVQVKNAIRPTDGNEFTFIPITLGYRNEYAYLGSDLYELHIYELSNEAYLTELVASVEKDSNNVDVPLPLMPQFTVPDLTGLVYTITMNEVRETIDFPHIQSVEGSTMTITWPDGTVEQFPNYRGPDYQDVNGEGMPKRSVDIQPGVNTMYITVISEDKSVSRTYTVIIQNVQPDKESRLRDIQVILDRNTDKARWRDFSPVFDPEQNIYFYALDKALVSGNDPVTVDLKPVVEDLSNNPTESYEISYILYKDDGTPLGSPTYTAVGNNQYISLPLSDMEQGTYTRIVINVLRKSSNNQYAPNRYTIFFFVNSTDFDETGEPLVELPALSDMKLDGQELTRNVFDHNTDDNFYATVTGNNANLAASATYSSVAGYDYNVYNLNSLAKDIDTYPTVDDNFNQPTPVGLN